MSRPPRDPNRLKFAVTAADNARPLIPPKLVKKPLKRGGKEEADASAAPQPVSLAEMQLHRDAPGPHRAAGDPHISLSRGEPIAAVKHGRYDGAIVHVTDEPGEAFDGADPIYMLGVDWFKGKKRGDGKRLRVQDIDELHDALVAGSSEYLDEALGDLYTAALEAFTKINDKELLLPDDGCLRPLPDSVRRECIYITGPSGSGKSTWAAQYCAMFRKMVPDIRIYVFSRLKEDGVLDVLKPVRVVLDDEFLQSDPYEPVHFENSIVLFDDIDTLTDERVCKKVSKLRSDILETGRHQNVWCLTTGHMISNRERTRVVLNECTKVTVFPKSGSTYHIRRLLKEYFGFDKKQIDKTLGLPSRWVTITRTAPQLVIHEKGCFIV